jgi:hypothetical protein
MSFIDKLQEIQQTQQAIENYGTLNNDVLNKINYKFRLEWKYYSNKMGGSYLT